MSLPNSMKAAILTGHGGNEVVAFGERPLPERQPGDVLVRVHAATLNRVDLYMRDSGAGITHTLPQVMGVDGAGVVVEVDADERLLKPGQRVVLHPGIGCGRCEFCQRGDHPLCVEMRLLGEHRDGTFAEYVSLPARNVFPAPEGFDFVEAAAIGVNHLTAWRMLFSKAQMKPWETALIFGIGGGVSLAALQLVKMIGARAIVTSQHDDKLAQARDFGADVAINGAKQDVVRAFMDATNGRGVDVVIENVGAAVWPLAMKSLVRGGRLVTCGATTGGNPSADLQRLFIRQLQVFGSTLGDFAEFRDLLRACDLGRIKPVIDRRFPLAHVRDALDMLESGRQFGKIALEIGDA